MLEEFINYIIKNKFKLYCPICETWTSNDQVTWKPCCYYSRNPTATLEHITEMAQFVKQEGRFINDNSNTA